MSSGRSRPLPPESSALRGRSGLRRGGIALGALLLVWAAAAAGESPAESPPAKAEKVEVAPTERPPQAEGTPVPKGDRKPQEPTPEPSEADRVKIDPDPLLGYTHIEDEAPLRSEEQNEDEHKAYNYTIAKAHKIAPDVLARNSRPVPFANLIKPVHKDYLLDLIHVEGRLARLEELKSTSFLRESEGIKKLYEGWLFPKGEQFPVCILFTELPEGLRPALKLENTWAAFDGYYFKLMHYESGEEKSPGKNVWRKAPLLIGHTIQQQKPPAEEDSGLSFGSMMTLLVVGLSVIIAVALGLSVWFRRGDRRVQEQVRQTQYQNNPFQSPPPRVEPGPGWGEVGGPSD